MGESWEKVVWEGLVILGLDDESDAGCGGGRDWRSWGSFQLFHLEEWESHVKPGDIRGLPRSGAEDTLQLSS
jgi:hypothetical protein